jgi:D-arginine dehydrogenase
LAPRQMLWVATAEDLPELDELLAEQPTLRRLSSSEIAAACPVLRLDRIAGAAVEADACDIDVAGLQQRYLGVARRHGVPVLHSTRLLGVDRQGDRWLLRHAMGELSAGAVVNAAGAWADHVATLLGAGPCGLRPLRRTIAIARTPVEVDSAWPLVADVAERYYFRPEGPHVLVCPADEDPSDPCDARPDEAQVALAIERVNEATRLEIRSVVTAWAGLRTFAPDRNPVVGPDPDVPGLFWLAGQGGYGIQMAPALARLAAALIRHEPPPTDVDLARLSPGRFKAGVS